jgi:hypothetical protein
MLRLLLYTVFLDTAYNIACFIDKYIVDRKFGEWYFRVNINGKSNNKYEKAGF